MGNKLKELFKKQDPYGFTIHFNDLNIAKDFQKKFKECQTDPRKNSFSIKKEKLAEISRYRKTPEGNFPEDNITNVCEIMLFFPGEAIQFKIFYEGQFYNISFNRFKKGNKTYIENDPNSIIHLSFYNISNSKQIQLHWRINFNKASSYIQLAKECEVYSHLLIKLINPTINVIPEEFKENIVILYRLAEACKRIVKIEEKLGMHFSPSKCTHSEKEISKFEFMYQTLVKEKPIRDDQSYENVTSTVEKSAPPFEIGTEILLQHNFTEIISVAEKDIALYTMQFYFNALVNNIEIGDEGNKIIFTGTDEKPLYSVKKYYLPSSDIPKITGEDTFSIMNAKTLSEILSDLEKQERTEVEELLKKGRENIKLKFDKIECIPEDNSNQ